MPCEGWLKYTDLIKIIFRVTLRPSVLCYAPLPLCPWFAVIMYQMCQTRPRFHWGGEEGGGGEGDLSPAMWEMRPGNSKAKRWSGSAHSASFHPYAALDRFLKLNGYAHHDADDDEVEEMMTTTTEAAVVMMMTAFLVSQNPWKITMDSSGSGDRES